MSNYVFYPPQQNYHNNQKIDLGDLRVSATIAIPEGVSQVVYNNNTIVDMSYDNVTPEVVHNGYMFHAANGNVCIGTYDPVDVSQDTIVPEAVLNGYTFHDANKSLMVGTLVPPPNINYDNMVIVHDKTNGDYVIGNCGYSTQYTPTAQSLFYSNSIFNESITIGNNVKSVDYMLYACYNFNQSPLIFPHNVNNFCSAMGYCNNFQGNIYIENTSIVNIRGMLQGTNNYKIKNIYCPNLYWFTQTSSSYSVVGQSIYWYSNPSNNCYYNMTYNIYLYNYLPENYV